MTTTVIKLTPSPKEPDTLEAPVSVLYKSADGLETQVGNVLATIQYQPTTRSKSGVLSETGLDVLPKAIDQPIDVQLRCLSPKPYLEVWHAASPVVEDHWQNVSYRKSKDIMFGVIKVEESSYRSLEDCTFQCYRQILQLIQTEGFPSLLRVWNYFDQINAETKGIERYKSFCVGRHKAFSIVPDFERYLTAASAIGAQSKNFFLIYFIAARNPAVQIENPRQMSAFHYPDQYGPKSPSFTRAILKNWKHVSQLYISGTASIVGHQTLHEGNPLLQLEETLKNLQSLLGHVREVHLLDIGEISNISALKVYIRHQQHYSLIKEALRKSVGKEIPILFLCGEICRANLLLEIEGFANIKR